MFNKKKVLVVIPARAGSKGIPLKNIQLLAGKPLIAYSIEKAKESKYVDNVIVSTDSERIAEVAKKFGAEVPFLRPVALASDSATLDPTIFHAFQEMKKLGFEADFVVTLQPTSPLLNSNSIDLAIEQLEKEKADSVVCVSEDRHLFWKKIGKKFFALQKERKNRQLLAPLYRENGSLFVSKKTAITENNRLGKKCSLFVIKNDSEVIDVHSPIDLWLAEKSLFNKRLLFRLEGYNEIGFGHVYRGISIAKKLPATEILFLLSKKSIGAVELIKSNGLNAKIFQDNKEFEEIFSFKPDIIINDFLDTSAGYLEKLLGTNAFVVNFEDVGEGTKKANLVINALYSNNFESEKFFCGAKYVCLRDEFKHVPFKRIKEKVENILVTFGGCDENNLALKAASAIAMLPGDFFVSIVLGLGYNRDEKEIEAVLKKAGKSFSVLRNVERMSDQMVKSDLIITAYGTTVYEAATTRTPVIALAQNDRELLHPFVSEQNGIIGLGLGAKISTEKLAQEIKRLIENPALRKLLSIEMEKAYDDFGAERVVSLILNKYQEWKNENNNWKK